MQRILILSEDAPQRDIVRLALEGIPAEVCCMADGHATSEACREQKFDVALILGTAPFLSGSETIRTLRRPHTGGRTALIALTRQHDEESIMRLVEAGADQCMGIPVNLHRLRRKVVEQLNRSQL